MKINIQATNSSPKGKTCDVVVVTCSYYMDKLAGNGKYTIADKVQYATVVADTPKRTQVHCDTYYILTQQSCLPTLLIH